MVENDVVGAGPGEPNSRVVDALEDIANDRAILRIGVEVVVGADEKRRRGAGGGPSARYFVSKAVTWAARPMMSCPGFDGSIDASAPPKA